MEFDEFAQAFADECTSETIEWLSMVGEEAYDKAMASHAFQSRTGCLLSSIGWGVARGGSIIRRGGFNQVLDGGEGVKQGVKTLEEAASPEGLELIFVAGMGYATFVEARGYDVNTAGELIIDELMSEPW